MRFGLVFECFKNNGGEMSLRTKGITVISFLTSILMGMSGGGFANAETTAFKISDNPDSAQSVVLSHVIHDAYPQSNAKIHYQITWCDERPMLSPSTSFRTIGGDLEFRDAGRNSDGDAIASDTVSFADMSFSTAGTYEFCAYEAVPDADGGIPEVDHTQFKIIVDVVNEYDSNGEPTGNLIPTLVPQALNMTTGEKGEIVFETTAEKTSWQFTHNVSGAKGDKNHYFPYDVSLAYSRFTARGTKFDLAGLDASFKDSYTGRDKTNPTEISAGPGKIRVYLKDGQTLKIGQRNGKDDLPPNSSITIEAVSEVELESIYDVTINGNAISSFESNLVLRPGENATEAELLAYQQNNDVKVVRTAQSNAVSTGLAARVMPFVALILIAGVVGVVAYKSDKKKKTREL